MNLAFNISGEYITTLARQWFYDEKKPFEKVKELLLSCMCGTSISKKTLNTYVEDILKFKRKFIGNTEDNTFRLVEDNEVNDKVKYYKDIKKYGKIPFEVCEYGFINPQGKYIPVKWCNHQKWAYDFINEKYTIIEQMKKSGKYVGADFLVYIEGWILLHNAQHGTAYPEIWDKRITKAQKETLYDYYIYFGRIEEANKLYEEEN